MANLNVSSQELDAILSELEGELNGLLADTSNRLAKAREEDGSPSPGMGSASASAGSPSASAGGEGSPAPEGSPGGEGAPPMGGAPEGGEGAPPADPAAAGAPPAGAEGGVPGEGAPPEGAPGQPGMEGAEGGMDPQALEAEYAQLPLEELKAHYLAAKAALFAAMQGGGDPAAAGAGAPPAGPAAGASPSAPPAAPPAGPSASAGAPPMAMSEGKNIAGVSQQGNGGQKVAVKKSETEQLQEQIEALTKIVSGFVNRPMQKAITGTTYVRKSEDFGGENRKPMSENEITDKLTKLTRDPNLKKSDRDAINRYYEGAVKIDAIEHLLK